ncbi:hypothetical protein HELRODRAFT_192122 [Helobdella robusta]|uniref:Uncharacterized protein n=1 Tax=Helobdella robusta TaxID=6412 RepID=T1FTL4_HELRO|nr:hypothetical protein HELRODRAFT_192122 [Helobdella robusta]ESO03141.1 hypothetical protein HELRODRAFT_192122 [Helobdella robusta]
MLLIRLIPLILILNAVRVLLVFATKDDIYDKLFLEIEPDGPYQISQMVNFTCSMLTKRKGMKNRVLYVFHIRSPIDDLPPSQRPWKVIKNTTKLENGDRLFKSKGSATIRNNTMAIMCSLSPNVTNNETTILKPLIVFRTGALTSDENGGLNIGVIVGASVVVVIAVGGIVAFAIMRLRKRSAAAESRQ